jgi:hypothetical protein
MPAEFPPNPAERYARGQNKMWREKSGIPNESGPSGPLRHILSLATYPVRLEAQPRPQRPSVTPFRIAFDGSAAVHSPGAARCPHPYSEPRLYPQALDSARFIMPAPANATTA